jgi:hypothetical protein
LSKSIDGELDKGLRKDVSFDAIDEYFMALKKYLLEEELK